MKKNRYIKYKSLVDFTYKVLKKSKSNNFTALSVSKGLCDASLRGVDSHGIRLLPHYLNSVINGRKNGKPNFKIKKKYPAVASLDADNAFGIAAGYRAVNLGTNLANKYGISSIAVYNSSHPGALASIVLDSAKKGFLTLAFTHADSLMKTFNGRKPYFGTNPICFAVPREKNKDPYCLDMATSKISWNKLLKYRDANKKLPKGVAADLKGNETRNASKAFSLLPIGSYKGYGLASMVEILCGILTGMNFGKSIPPMFTADLSNKRKLGQFYIFIKSDICISNKKFITRMTELYNEIKSDPKIPNKEIMLPNDPEINFSKIRKKEGIPLEYNLFLELEKIAKKYNENLKLNNIK